MTTDHAAAPSIAVLGSFPPLRAISGYCVEFALALADYAPIRFLSFKTIYPAFLYPGGGLKDDQSFPKATHPALEVSRKITWYNPFGWLKEGFSIQAELLHAQWWSLPLAPIYIVICLCFRVRGKPVVMTVHNVTAHEQSKLFPLLAGLLFRTANHFIVHTQQNKASLSTHYAVPLEKISVIPHGTLDLFVAGEENRNLSRKMLGFSETHRVVLLFGAIRLYKGVDTTLLAFSKIADKVPEARLLIAGKAWIDWAPYEQLIETLEIKERVHCHLDYVPSDEVARYFEAADLVVLPYHHFDSQSGVGSAALAFDKPLIVSDVGGLPDLVKDKSFVVPPQQPDALADAMLRSLGKPGQLEHMQAESRELAEEMSWRSIAQTTLALYRRLLAAPSSGRQ